jgi:hypothetical protein
MESTKMLMTGEMTYAGAARPPVGGYQPVCVWSISIAAASKPATFDGTNHNTTTSRRLWESSQ